MVFRKLMDTLEQLQRHYCELYELGLQKKEQLIQNRLDELTATLNKESKLLKQIELVERERVAATIQLQTNKGLRPIPNVTLTEVGRMLIHAEEKLELQDMQRRLTETLAVLKPLNELNQQLIEQSLAIVEYSLDLLSDPDEEIVYQHPSAVQYGKQKRRLFDTRA